ncbi:MAG: TonB-dependent receptor plug domain-containing protein [Sediminibacterium sp.]|jgi:outer membrane cobalamin receptor
MWRRLLALHFIIVSLFTKQAFAQKDSVQKLEEVIVTATRMPVSTQQVPFTFTVKDSKKNSILFDRTVPESLSSLPGVFIQKTNHGGGSPFVRGMTGNQNLILIDGFRLNNSIFRYGPNQYLTLLDAQSVDRVEVVKGTGSVQFGSDALGGVINVLTYTPQFTATPTWAPILNIRGTSAGMEKTIRPSIGYSNRKVAIVVASCYSDFGDLKGGDTTGFQRPSGYSQFSLNAKLNAQLNKTLSLQFAVSAVTQKKVPLYHRYQLDKFKIALSDPLQRQQTFIRVQKKLNSTLLREISIGASLQNLFEKRVSQSRTALAKTFEKDKINGFSFTAETFWTLKKNWTNSLSVELNRDHVISTRELLYLNGSIESKRGLYPTNSSYVHGAIFNLHQITLNQLRLDFGWRYHQYRINLFDSTLGPIKVKPNALVYLAGASFLLSAAITFYGNISSGYRAPNIDDMGTVGVIDFRYEVPAYDLKPEESLNKELGIRWRKQKIFATTSLFHTSYHNLITRIKTERIINNYSVYIKQNIERAFIWGTEWTLDGQVGKNWKGAVNFTYLFGQNVTRNEPMRRIPPMTCNFNIQYAMGNQQVGLFLESAGLQDRLAQGDKDDTRIPVGGTPGFSIWNLSISGKLNFVKYRVLFYNLFNKDFRTHGSGINGMGRAITISTSIALNNKK